MDRGGGVPITAGGETAEETRRTEPINNNHGNGKNVKGESVNGKAGACSSKERRENVIYKSIIMNPLSLFLALASYYKSYTTFQINVIRDTPRAQNYLRRDDEIIP